MARIQEVPGLDDAVRADLGRGQPAVAADRAIRGYGPQLLGYLVSVLRDEDVADDVFADACERLLRGIVGFRGDGTLRAWVYRVVWHALQDHLRDPRRRRERRLRSDDVRQLAAAVRETTRQYQHTSVRDRFARLREQLTSEDQTLLILRVGRSMSWREISDVLSRPGMVEEQATLRKRYERLKDRLRDLARDDGLLPS